MTQRRLASRVIQVVAVACSLALFTVSSQAATEHVLHEFSNGGRSPEASLVADSAGNLYGTTAWGGTGYCVDGNYSYGGCGTVFQLTPTANGGWKRTVLYSFQGGRDGQMPVAGVVLDSTGNLYGTTWEGGGLNVLCNPSSCGTVFELTRDSHGKWKESVLHRFTGFQDGASPRGGLVLDSEGNLYGTTEYGGSLTACANIEGCGVVFKLSPSANGKWEETVLYGFGVSASGVGRSGAYPEANVVFDSDGRLYGTTYGGGLYGYGAVFMLSKKSEGQWSEDVLRYFDSSSDGYPMAGVILDSENNVYGTTSGNFTTGTVFKLARSGSGGAWKETVLYAGGCPQAGLTMDRAGNLYGTNTSCSNYGPGAVFELSPGSGGWNYTALHTFGGNRDGYDPRAGLLLDQQGNLYGTTESGGPAGGESTGTVYKLTQSSGLWPESIISFFPGEDGISPQSNLIVDASGNFYGTTTNGGRYGLGAVFEETKSSDGSWKTNILHSFRGGSDGSTPVGALTFDSVGNLYGTSTDVCRSYGCGGWGTVFMLSPRTDGSWVKTTLYSFTGGSDGAMPNGGLTFDSAGNIYGTASQGGTGVCRDQNYYNVGCGTVFELSPSYFGWSFWLLHTFTNSPDGGWPLGGVVLDRAGNLYGSTSIGGSGCNGGCGTVFELSPGSGGNWNETILHNFAGEPNDGSYPGAALIFDGSGNLSGTTELGGTGAGGTVFEVAPSGQETVIYSFTGNADGQYPLGSLTFDASGQLYGTTSYGGDSSCWRGCGAVFRLTQTGGTWNESTLYDFTVKDGGLSAAGVILDAAGNIYGTTELGGTGSNGIFFEITP
jgi:uncharacterized repeat protein (TIGR03803 family)